MSGVDERIRREMHDGTRPVRTEGVLEHVSQRRVRRKRVRRIEIVTLTVAVLAGSVAGGVGLTRLFGHKEAGSSASGGSGSPTTGVEEGAMCDESRLSADLDGDGILDAVVVYSPSGGNSCDRPEVGQSYRIQISGGKLADHGGSDVRFYGVGRELTECTQPFACRVFAAPDLDADGTQELAVQISSHEGLRLLALYRLKPQGDAFELVRVTSPPGDPDPGYPPGSALFAWGSSEARKASLECRDVDGQPWLIVSTAQTSASKPGTYDVRETQFSLHDGVLKFEAKADYPGLPPDSNPPFVTPDTFCGAPIVA